jgi:hypothetical protein
MSKVRCTVCCYGPGTRNEHLLGSPPRLKVRNRLLSMVLNVTVMSNTIEQPCMVIIIQVVTATCLHDGALTVTQGSTTAACLDCFHLGQLH